MRGVPCDFFHWKAWEGGHYGHYGIGHMGPPRRTSWEGLLEGPGMEGPGKEGLGTPWKD